MTSPPASPSGSDPGSAKPVQGATSDSNGFRVQHQGWSYGGGLFVPLGGALDMFGEARYRMSSFVLPPPVSGRGDLKPLWPYQSQALFAEAASFST